MTHKLADMIGLSGVQVQTPHGYVRAVPIPFHAGLWGRVRDAWNVLTGKTYSVKWPEPGEFEDATRRK